MKISTMIITALDRAEFKQISVRYPSVVINIRPLILGYRHPKPSSFRQRLEVRDKKMTEISDMAGIYYASMQSTNEKPNCEYSEDYNFTALFTGIIYLVYYEVNSKCTLLQNVSSFEMEEINEHKIFRYPISIRLLLLFFCLFISKVTQP